MHLPEQSSPILREKFIVKKIISFILLCLSYACYAQGYKWATSAGGGGFAKSFDLVNDNGGNLYVTGYFSDTLYFNTGTGTSSMVSNGLNDIFLAKYDSNGIYVWSLALGGKNYDVSNAITIDADGNILIAGSFGDTVDFDPGPGESLLISKGGDDVFFAKYDANGALLMAKSLGGTQGEGAASLATDLNNNIYITGEFSATVDFDPSGIAYNLAPQWRDAFVASYDVNGNFRWAHRIGSTDWDTGRGIATDEDGNVYVTGWFNLTADFDPGAGTASLTSNGNDDFFLAKYSSSGDYLWAVHIGGTSGDSGYGIAIKENRICCYGIFRDTVDFDPDTGEEIHIASGSNAWFVTCFDSSGNHIWTKSFDYPIASMINDLIFDQSGNLFLTGKFSGTVDFDRGQATATLTSTGLADIFMASYSSSGQYIFSETIGGTNNDEGTAIVIDENGNQYVTGTFLGTVDFDPGSGYAPLTAGSQASIYVAKYGAFTINAVEQHAANFIRVFPNPSTTGMFSIINSSADENRLFEVMDIHGQVVASGKMSGTTTLLQLPFLPDGCYTLKTDVWQVRLLKIN
ncbi:MAG: hypothetical protein KatS3mg031_0980 [Chitinophagales bacterium]|nr:MAG: hypothetical protein KatS3mg031_0980 [Chitinophagales bacterium]